MASICSSASALLVLEVCDERRCGQDVGGAMTADWFGGAGRGVILGVAGNAVSKGIGL